MGTKGRATRPVWSVLLLLLTVCLLGGCASTGAGSAGSPSAQVTHPQPARTPSPPPTVSRVVTAFHADGSRAVRTARTNSGSCFTGSVAAPVADAYRCFSGNAILDPCLAPAGVDAPAELVCLASPWAKATLLRLTGPLPSADPVRQATRPWAMQLAGGIRCVAATGTVPVVRHVALLYSCTGGGSAGTPSPAVNGVRHAPYLAPHASAATSTALTEAWSV